MKWFVCRFRKVEIHSLGCKLLKENGKLFIYDFDKRTFMGKSLWAMEKLLGEPAHFYEQHALKMMLEAHGFNVQSGVTV